MMNYNVDKTKAFTVETKRKDRNGNTMRKITFFKKDNEGIMTKYKTIKTNEAIAHLSNDEIIKVLG